MTDISIGVDFGTTNTVVAVARADGGVAPITFDHAGTMHDIFRSALCFWDETEERARRIGIEAGPWAIAQFLESPYEHRFVQSFKSFAASHLFQSTVIFGKRFSYEDILSNFLSLLRGHAGAALTLTGPVIAGRPVEFVGASPDPALALRRMDASYARAGFPPVRYAYEPVGAAYYFARRLKTEAIVLVADFGGGTSDFSLMRFTKGAHGSFVATPLGHAGVGVAGDAFDYRIIDNVISPRLGKGGHYRSNGKRLPIPGQQYMQFAQWHQLAMLKSPKTMAELKALAKEAETPEALEDFITVIENDLGFGLYRAVSAVKTALSSTEKADLVFEADGIEIRESVTRKNFESWIAPELVQIDSALDRVFAAASLAPSAVDQVFMTGGSSFVPALRRLFEARFSADRLTTGDQLQSIASGLALIGLDRNSDAWLAPRG